MVASILKLIDDLDFGKAGLKLLGWKNTLILGLALQIFVPNIARAGALMATDAIAEGALQSLLPSVSEVDEDAGGTPQEPAPWGGGLIAPLGRIGAEALVATVPYSYPCTPLRAVVCRS